MDKIIVAGIDTDVGKTITAAVLTLMLNGTYWKPVDCGAFDTATIKQFNLPHLQPLYSFKTPCSPHYAAFLEGKMITPFEYPSQVSPLIIETAGGVLTPLTLELTNLDHFSTWNCPWILVSRHILGSINHTLLTVEALRRRNVDLLGIIFNGYPDPCSEEPILKQTQLACLGRLLPEPKIDRTTLQKYATQWKIPSGALSRR